MVSETVWTQLSTRIDHDHTCECWISALWSTGNVSVTSPSLASSGMVGVGCEVVQHGHLRSASLLGHPHNGPCHHSCTCRHCDPLCAGNHHELCLDPAFCLGILGECSCFWATQACPKHHVKQLHLPQLPSTATPQRHGQHLQKHRQVLTGNQHSRPACCSCRTTPRLEDLVYLSQASAAHRALWILKQCSAHHSRLSRTSSSLWEMKPSILDGGATQDRAHGLHTGPASIPIQQQYLAASGQQSWCEHLLVLESQDLHGCVPDRGVDSKSPLWWAGLGAPHGQDHQ
mmetsp:Transcript_35230/g.64369  ORF Transcript_35230/g.64369 Transcript_35230/m.64369 type:complete len:287 (+) Transcript_35230:292-1152(+)